MTDQLNNEIELLAQTIANFKLDDCPRVVDLVNKINQIAELDEFIARLLLALLISKVFGALNLTKIVLSRLHEDEISSIPSLKVLKNVLNLDLVKQSSNNIEPSEISFDLD
jgi:hypothetical protein